MDYKENDIWDRIHKMYDDMDEAGKFQVERVFPELKESEDDKVRKNLIHLVKKSHEQGGYALHKWEADEMLAWLEKQGKHANFRNKIQIGDKVTRNENGVLVNLSQLKRVTKPANEEQKDILEDAILDSNEDGLIAETIRCKKEKQGDQKPQGKSALEAVKEEKVDNQNCVKPADKVETKFKDGDWVVYNNDICQIVKREEGCNKLITVFGIEKELVNERNLSTARFWTIQDAKDGDILCYKDEISLYRHDIKNCTKQETTFGGFVYYCCYDGKRFIVDSLYSLTEQDKMDIHPATKEQRDALMKAMTDAGYTFYFEKKELKKINAYCQDNCKGYQETGKCFADENCKAKREAESININKLNNSMTKNFNISIDESLVDEQVTAFCNITKKMCELYAKKNHDYGNSFDEGCDKIGVGYPLGRLLDKMNRLIACMGKEDEMQVNESIEDTLTDLGCYSIMTLSYLKRHKDGKS